MMGSGIAVVAGGGTRGDARAPLSETGDAVSSGGFTRSPWKAKSAVILR